MFYTHINWDLKKLDKSTEVVELVRKKNYMIVFLFQKSFRKYHLSLIIQECFHASNSVLIFIQPISIMMRLQHVHWQQRENI